jgi:hypothetical protein
MNDGILTLILQWCLLCLFWMGMFDRPLRKILLTRAQALALITLFLVCSFANWKLYFLPVVVNVSGTILPLLFSAWVWAVLPFDQRGYCILAALFTVFLLFAARMLLFWDPVLLVMDEQLLLTLMILCSLFILTREWRQQLFIILTALPLADALYTLSFLKKANQCLIGGGYAQDLLWITIPFWMAAALFWTILHKGIVNLRAIIVRHK